MYLKIQSLGEIDTKAFTILGNSTKRQDEAKIGMFGSGLKYGISALLRNKHKFYVFSGLNQIMFSTEKETFRDLEMNIITIDGKRTSFTTDMGDKSWDNPFAPVREIYSNALDEDEYAKIDKVAMPDPEENTTTFYIQMTKEVEHFYENRQLYFCTTNPNVEHTNKSGSIYRSVSEECRLFRKGILCYSSMSSNERSPFMYNSPYFEINESRVLSNHGKALRTISSIWKRCMNIDLISELINSLRNSNTGTFEHDCPWERSWIYDDSPHFSDAWEAFIRNKEFMAIEHLDVFSMEVTPNVYVLPLKLIKALKDQFPWINVLGMDKGSNEGVLIVSEPPKDLEDLVLDSIVLLNQTNYKARWKGYGIKYAQFDSNRKLYDFKDGNIRLSVKCRDLTSDEMSKALILMNEEGLTKDLEESHLAHNQHLIGLYYKELLTAGIGKKNQ